MNARARIELGRRVGLLALLLVAGVSACASQPNEEFAASEPKAAERAEQVPNADLSAVEGAVEATPADGAERSLAQLELELANNEARLRELGVKLNVDTNTVAGGEVAQERKDADSKPPKKKPKDNKSAGGASKPSATPSAPRPMTEPSTDTQVSPSRDEKGDASAADKDKDDRFAPPPPKPDAAKAAPPSGNVAELDAAARCQQVCDLGQMTCELSVQICEIADRHDGEDDYRAACERSADDCSAAQEACDACEG